MSASPLCRRLPSRAAHRSARSSSRLQGSENRTPGSRCGSSWRRGFRGQDLGQRFNVDLVEHTLPAGLLQARDELGPEEIDSRMEQTPLIGDLVLLTGEVVDQVLEIVVGEVREVRERFQRAAFRVEGPSAVKQRTAKGST